MNCLSLPLRSFTILTAESVSFISHPLCFAVLIPPCLSFSHCCALCLLTPWRNVSEQIHKAATLIPDSYIFCKTYQKALGPILRRAIWILLWISREGCSVVLFLLWLMHISPQKEISVEKTMSPPHMWTAPSTLLVPVEYNSTNWRILPTQKTSLRTSGIPWVRYWSM